MFNNEIKEGVFDLNLQVDGIGNYGYVGMGFAKYSKDINDGWIGDHQPSYIFSTFPFKDHPICAHYPKMQHVAFLSFPCFKNKEIITVRYDNNLHKLSLLINLIDTGICIEGVPSGLVPVVSFCKGTTLKVVFFGWKKENFSFLPLLSKRFVFNFFMVRQFIKKKGIVIDKNIFHKILEYIF
eukprot:TRINITY_DN14193_c0_g1_i1.p1 TRINITY_DN14193_c0_g1~~TRINITY_DN14193_c0_g1_i1.p1  ORF type:complete len:182 (-),score=42.10 TRINITY_DN14193_c0_g1_i1:11-556(-)